MSCPLDCLSEQGWEVRDVKAVIKSRLSIQERNGDNGLGVLNESIRTLGRSDRSFDRRLTIVSADQGGNGLFRVGLSSPVPVMWKQRPGRDIGRRFRYQVADTGVQSGVDWSALGSSLLVF